MVKGKTVSAIILLFVIGTYAQTTTISSNTAQSVAGNPVVISRGAIALDMNEREPLDTGSVFPPEVKRLYCFTEIKNLEGGEIQHRWYWKDEMVSSVSLKITSGRFRTYSAKTIIPSMTGDWRVAVVNSSDESVLKMIAFTVK